MTRYTSLYIRWLYAGYTSLYVGYVFLKYTLTIRRYTSMYVGLYGAYTPEFSSHSSLQVPDQASVALVILGFSSCSYCIILHYGPERRMDNSLQITKVLPNNIRGIYAAMACGPPLPSLFFLLPRNISATVPLRHLVV